MPHGSAHFAIALGTVQPDPSQIQRKRLDYQQSGVIQVWFDLEKQLVELIYPDRPRYCLADQALTLDAVSGFSLDLKDLFSI